MSSRLNQMRERLSKIDDVELLEVAKELLSEMSEIYNLKQQIEMREDKLSEGKRAVFYFFAAGLEPEELSHATNTAIGRIRFLKEMKERKEMVADQKGIADQSVDLSGVEIPQGSFGGLGSSFGGLPKK